MKKNYIILAMLIVSLAGYANNAYSSEEKPVEGKVVQEAEKTYEQKAKELGDKIKEGFIKTSYVPSITSCIASGTKRYAGFTSPQDQEKADSITEKYLLMGKDEGLDLTDKDAVYDFLVKKFDARIGQNVEKGASYIPSAIVNFGAKCARMGGDAYYKIRLKQALEWAFTNQVKDLPEFGLAKEEEKEEKKD